MSWENKNPCWLPNKGFRDKSLAMTDFGMDESTLSLALNGFTSEFEMGSGGTHLLKSPGNIHLRILFSWSSELLRPYQGSSAYLCDIRRITLIHFLHFSHDTESLRVFYSQERHHEGH